MKVFLEIFGIHRLYVRRLYLFFRHKNLYHQLRLSLGLVRLPHSTPVAEIPVTPASNDLLEYANGDDTQPEVVLLKLIGDSGFGVPELKVVVPNSCPNTGLKSTASANSNSPSGSRPPKSTLLGT